MRSFVFSLCIVAACGSVSGGGDEDAATGADATPGSDGAFGADAETGCANCSEFASCTQNMCVCDPGFVGDGRTCVEAWTFAGQLDGVILGDWHHVFGVNDHIFVAREDGSDANRYFMWINALSGEVGSAPPSQFQTSSGYGGKMLPSYKFGSPRIYYFDGTGEWFDTTTSVAWSPFFYPDEFQRGEAAGAEHEGNLYLVGGRAFGGDVSDTLVYNPVDDGWSYGLPYPFAVSDAVGVSAAGRLYVIGGWTNIGDTRTMHSLSASSGGIPEWTPHADAPTDVSRTEAVYQGGKIRVRSDDRIYSYDVEAQAWEGASIRMPTIGSGSGAIATAAGNLYAVIEDLTSVKFYRYNGP